MKNPMFDSFCISNLQMKNRLVASAMFEYAAENGKITDTVKNRYRQLAEGGFGLIITGMQGVNESGAFAPIMINAQYDGYSEDIRDLAQIAHQNGSKLIVQLNHCGKNDDMTVEDLQKIARDFGSAASKCKIGGADGVQIHAGHGFLINSLLSPSTNHRNDIYGGEIENRARMLFDAYSEIRKSVGNDFIVGVKFPFSDLIENSISPEESMFAMKRLEEMGIDFVEITSGMVMDGSKASFAPRIGKNEAPFLKNAEIAADGLNIPVISVCGYRTPQFVNQVLENTKIAAISFGRATVREPNLASKWMNSSEKATCISCNQCANSFNDGVITCQVAKKLAHK